MKSMLAYCLTEGVQVRQEKFGLLFYDYKGPRLYFVPSSDLVADRFFGGTETVNELIDIIYARRGWPRQWIMNWVYNLLETLEAKGLVHGKSLC